VPTRPLAPLDANTVFIGPSRSRTLKAFTANHAQHHSTRSEVRQKAHIAKEATLSAKRKWGECQAEHRAASLLSEKRFYLAGLECPFSTTSIVPPTRRIPRKWAGPIQLYNSAHLTRPLPLLSREAVAQRGQNAANVARIVLAHPPTRPRIY